MIKVSSKFIKILCGFFSCLIVFGTIAINLILKKDKFNNTSDDHVKSKRKNYQHFSLINQLSISPQINKLVKVINNKTNYIYVIDENNFKNTIKSVVYEIFKQHPVFKSNYLAYKINCKYTLINSKKINVEIVWYLPTSNIKYFDQFSVALN